MSAESIWKSSNDGSQCKLVIKFYDSNIVRLLYTTDDNNAHELHIPPTPEGLNKPENGVEARILCTKGKTVNSELKIDGKRIYCGGINVELETPQQIKINDRIINLKTEKEKSEIKVRIDDEEYFFGGGCQNGRFSHKGEEIAIENTNNWVDGGVASPAPFFWSTGGYGMMWHTFAPGKYDFGKSNNHEAILSHETPYIDVFFMIGKDAETLLNCYYKLTGAPVLMPKFAFYEGHLNAYNRDYWREVSEGGIPFEDGKSYKESQKPSANSEQADKEIKESLNGENGNYQFSARAVIDRYLQKDFPLGWILPNDGYGAGYGQTNSIDDNIQNLKALGDYARSLGVEIGLWTQSDLHPKEGIEPLLQRDIIKEVRDAGVRVLKTDVAWVGAGYSFGLSGVTDVAQIMPQYGNNARPFIITLDGWAGTQRYAGIWTGDQTGGDWEYIRFHIPTYIGCGLSGQPNITSDMDGIFGGGNAEVNIRDFQWKTFTPMQLNMDGWGINPKYPWALGEEAAKINRWYLKLKSMLLPYTYTIAEESTRGKPMVRAMFLEESNGYTLGTNTQYQFMYGPNILVAPIYKEGNMRNDIYLPHGEWEDFFTGDIYEGGKIINNFHTPIWKLPVFIKRGAIIPFHKPTLNPSGIDSHLRCIAIYPNGESEFTEYDDDGKTTDYLNGNYLTTKIISSLQKDRLKVTISPSKTYGKNDFFEREKSTFLVIFCSEQPKSVKVRGHKLTLAQSQNECIGRANSYFYGNLDDEFVSRQALMINIGSSDVCSNELVVDIKGIKINNTDHLLRHKGNLPTPKCKVADKDITAYSLTPSWARISNADYYEIEFDGQIYSTITDTCFTFENLNPNQAYSMKIRCKNIEGMSEWVEINATTAENPLKDAIKGICGTTSCENQDGQEIDHLFDFDETSVWHTDWNTKAVPFEINIDLGSMNHLDKLVYIPRSDAGNGTLLSGTIETSTDGCVWSQKSTFEWERGTQKKELSFSDDTGKTNLQTNMVRYLRMYVTKAVGDFGSGRQLYIFRKPNSDWYIPGDINHDGKLDQNDLTSYMNYTGLRKGDSDFEGYISQGDINGNGLIDASDIYEVVRGMDRNNQSHFIRSEEKQTLPNENISLNADRKAYNTSDTITLILSTKDFSDAIAFSLCIPYNSDDMEYLSNEMFGFADMTDMTRDRLHTNGTKALYPTFIRTIEKYHSEQLRSTIEKYPLIKFRFRAKKAMTFQPKCSDIIVVR